MFVGVYVGGRAGGLIGIYLMCMYGFPLFFRVAHKTNWSRRDRG